MNLKTSNTKPRLVLDSNGVHIKPPRVFDGIFIVTSEVINIRSELLLLNSNLSGSRVICNNYYFNGGGTCF